MRSLATVVLLLTILPCILASTAVQIRISGSNSNGYNADFSAERGEKRGVSYTHIADLFRLCTNLNNFTSMKRTVRAEFQKKVGEMVDVKNNGAPWEQADQYIIANANTEGKGLTEAGYVQVLLNAVQRNDEGDQPNQQQLEGGNLNQPQCVGNEPNQQQGEADLQILSEMSHPHIPELGTPPTPPITSTSASEQES